MRHKSKLGKTVDPTQNLARQRANNSKRTKLYYCTYDTYHKGVHTRLYDPFTFSVSCYVHKIDQKSSGASADVVRPRLQDKREKHT